MKQAGIKNKEIMEQLGIKNKTQIKTWMRWYKAGQTYQFRNKWENNIPTVKGLRK